MMEPDLGLWQTWWFWVVAGLALGILELFAPGYIFLGFMVGALGTGVLIGVGVLGGSFPVALTAFAVLSLIAWVVMRATLGKRANAVKTFERDVNDG